MTDIVGHLMRMGLTEYEAKAYIATVTLGGGTIKEISEQSGVPRSRAYDVMDRLVRKGLAEVGSSSPRCYRANEPITAHNHLVEEIRRTSEVVVRELSKMGRKAESRDNPIWTVKGEWAIDHKVDEILERAKREISIVCLNNKNNIRYAKIITQASERKRVTILLYHQPESFVGLLGKSRVMRIKPIPASIFGDDEGTIDEKGFVTKDGRYCIEFVVHTDQDESLVVTKEGEGRRAIIITGTILNFFSHQSVEQVIQSAEEVTAPKSLASGTKAL